MDYKGFLQKLSDLDNQISELIDTKYKFIQHFKEKINEPYKHLLNQKVVVKYLTFDKEKKKEIAYFGGYRIPPEIFVPVPVFYKIKANGDMSSQRYRFEWEEIISIEGLETETEEPLKVGDKLTIKKILNE